jgi:hypothetical protein
VSLLDRLAFDDQPPGPPFPTADGETGHIRAHQFAAAMWFRVTGDATDAQVIAMFDLSVEDQIQYNAMITFWTGLNATKQGQFKARLESALVLLQGGLIGRAKFKSLLGISP